MRYAPILLLLAVLAGCGGSAMAPGDMKQQPGTTAPTSSSAPTPSPSPSVRPAPNATITSTSRPKKAVGAARVFPWFKPAQADGSTVTFSFGAGACEYYWVDVKEASTSVTLTLEAASKPMAKGEVCPAIAYVYAARITLKAPVGTRTIIDGACELPGYVDDPACKKS